MEGATGRARRAQPVVSRSLLRLDSRFRPYAQGLLEVAQRFGLNPVVTSTRRTLAEQAALYREYLAGRHPYPVAPPGRSQHNYGLAIDLVSEDNDWLGAVWRHWGGSWSSSDRVHFGVR